VVVATQVNADEHREILGIDLITTEDGAGWTAFLWGLVARGLSGPSACIRSASRSFRTIWSGVCLRLFMVLILLLPTMVDKRNHSEGGSVSGGQVTVGGSSTSGDVRVLPFSTGVYTLVKDDPKRQRVMLRTLGRRGGIHAAEGQDDHVGPGTEVHRCRVLDLSPVDC
jgi:Transposase, Mutator family